MNVDCQENEVIPLLHRALQLWTIMFKYKICHIYPLSTCSSLGVLITLGAELSTDWWSWLLEMT